MTKQRTFSVLLAVAVALLGLDLALRLSPSKATAQQPPWEGEPPVEITQINGVGYYTYRDVHRLYRLWSDGTIEVKVQLGGSWSGWRIVPE